MSKKYVLTKEAKERLEKLSNIDIPTIAGYCGAFCGYMFGLRVSEAVLSGYKATAFEAIGGVLFSMYIGNQVGVLTLKMARKIEDGLSEDDKNGGSENKN